MDRMNKGGRPRVSRVLSKSYTDKKSYNKEYRNECRYIFTVNLSQDKDSDIIEALESFGKNRQGALKFFLRLGIEQNKRYKKKFNIT